MFYFIANNLALDLMNTLIVENGEPLDLLDHGDDVLEWAAGAGLIVRNSGKNGVKKTGATRDAKKLLEEIKALRELIRSMVGDLMRKGSVSISALNRLNASLQKNRGFFAVRKGDDGYRKQFRSEADDIRSLLAPIAESAADLLCFIDPAYIRKCESNDCVLHFYDTSKNHRRRWCSMAACGNRAKAAAFYKRKKGGE
jgi:predicted RNA-binding Zn ribbon-like protein